MRRLKLKSLLRDKSRMHGPRLRRHKLINFISSAVSGLHQFYEISFARSFSMTTPPAPRSDFAPPPSYEPRHRLAGRGSREQRTLKRAQLRRELEELDE